MLGGIGFLSMVAASVANLFVRGDHAAAQTTATTQVQDDLALIRAQLDRIEQALAQRG